MTRSKTTTDTTCNPTTTTTKNRLEKDAAIAIVGCGISGLSTAIALQQAGFSNISLYERDASPWTRREGFGLTLSYNPKGPLAQLGILEAVAQQDCPSRSHYLFAPNGTVLGYYGNAFLPGRGFGQRGNIRVPRQNLQKIMTERVLSAISTATTSSGMENKQAPQNKEKPGSSAHIYWGHSLTAIRELQKEGKVDIEFDCPSHNQPINDPTDLTNIAVTKTFDLVVAADGVRSSVVQCLAPHCQPKPLNVMLILGITNHFHHPLLTERGFYVLDGQHRFFTMPYQGDKYSSEQRIMWQLTYRFPDTENNDGYTTTYLSPGVLRDKVMEICSQWHEPVPSMIQATPLETIWGTPLFDRQPKNLQKAFQSYSRVVVVGDALHAMSPFKGQGANQSLLDGPLVADWLQRARVDAAVRGVWREAVQRTDKVVEASRQASQYWHSLDCLPNLQVDDDGKQTTLCHFAGVRDGCANMLVRVLAERKITATLSADLDDAVWTVIKELQIGSLTHQQDCGHEDDQHLYSKILEYASSGALSELRSISLNHASAVRCARDEQQRSGLLLASQFGHYETCRWFITEALADPWAVECRGRSPLDVATSPSIISFLKKVMGLRMDPLINEKSRDKTF